MGGDPDLVGATVADRYAVVRLLGDGGMGAVYKATDQVLLRFVAVKLLHRRVSADPLGVERFQREARSAAAIGHPNIIDVMDFGDSTLGPFMVMEYLRGRSLAAILERERRLDTARACSIAAHTLAGLAAAHERGILHRDLKPANLMMVTRLGDHDFVKVCDFGFAAFLEPRTPASRDITPEQTLVGTPSYAAPERWSGDDKRDLRADLYSVGVILHEMLAGTKPFRGATVSELAHRIRNEAPPPLRSLRPDVPPELERVIRRALAKTPNERWPNAAAFAEALVPFGGRTVQPDDDDPSEIFALDLIQIKARDAQHRGAEPSIELRDSELLTIDGDGPARDERFSTEQTIGLEMIEVDESQIRERVPPPALLTARKTPAPTPPPGVPHPTRRGVPVALPARAFEGTVALVILRFLTERYGDGAVRTILEGLPEPARGVFRDGIRPGLWVPYDAVRRLMEQIDRTLGHDDLHIVVDCGRAIADGVFDQRRDIEPTATTPERYLSELPAVGPHLVRGVGYAIRRLGPGHGRLELVEDTDQPSITGCVTTLGFIERGLERFGAKDVEVNLVGCRALGDARCLFDISWL